jgi:multiple sugar transport system permease protein
MKDINLDDKAKYQLKGKAIWLILTILTALMIVLILFPPYWMLNSSLLPISKVQNIPVMYFPFDITFTNYEAILAESDFPMFYANSLVMSFGVVVLTTTLSTFAGYGLTRIEFPYKRTFARSILFGYMFPPILLAIPMFIIFRDIGIINSYLGAILAITAVNLPLTIWIMWQFFQTVPMSQEESARMAGASRFRAFYEVALPQAKAGIIAVATLSFAGAWGDFTLSNILLVDRELWPLTVGILGFVKEMGVQWPQVMAAVTLGILPTIIFLYALHGHWDVISV